MTSPRTTLYCGQDAPLAYRSSAAPLSSLPQSRQAVFLRRDLRHPGRLLRSIRFACSTDIDHKSLISFCASSSVLASGIGLTGSWTMNLIMAYFCLVYNSLLPLAQQPIRRRERLPFFFIFPIPNLGKPAQLNTLIDEGSHVGAKPPDAKHVGGFTG